MYLLKVYFYSVPIKWFYYYYFRRYSNKGFTYLTYLRLYRTMFFFSFSGPHVTLNLKVTTNCSGGHLMALNSSLQANVSENKMLNIFSFKKVGYSYYYYCFSTRQLAYHNECCFLIATLLRE